MKAQQQAPHAATQLDASEQVLLQLSRFPMNQLWRYVVDGHLQEKEGGWEAYDAREPGSVSAAIKGLAFALTHFSKPIDLELIRRLHLTCGAGVKLEGDAALGVFNNDDVYVQILPTVSTPQGFQEFLQSRPRHNIQGVLFIADEISTTPIVFHGHKAALTKTITIPLNHYTHEECKGCAQKLFESKSILSKEYRIVYYPPKSYNDSVRQSVNEILKKKRCKDKYEEKSLEKHTQDVIDTYNKEQNSLTDPGKRSDSSLLATQEFVRLHPFRDLVNRVFVNCLHFLMDIKNGYVPPLFLEPNIFEFSHLDLLKNHVAVGQKRAFTLIDNHEKPTFGISIRKEDPIPESLREATELFMTNLANELFFASRKYMQEQPHLAGMLLWRACDLLSKIKSPPAIVYAKYLNELGVCLKRTKNTQTLVTIIDRLRQLSKECRAEGSRLDLSNFSAVIDRYIERLSANENDQKKKSFTENKR